jgi:hypothetical protein
MKTKVSLSSTSLVFEGVILMGLGLYFIFIRPPLLPEDPRYMGTTLAEIQAIMPGLLIWLRRVFWVLGGFMFATGVLTTYVAVAVFQQLARGARSVVALAGLTSIGWMAVVNFMIDSDFKWLLLAFNLPWIVALVVSWRESRQA